MRNVTFIDFKKRFRPECLPAGKPETAKDRDIVAPAMVSFVVGTACPGEGDLVNELVQATEVAQVALVPFACFQGILMYASPSSTHNAFGVQVLVRPPHGLQALADPS